MPWMESASVNYITVDGNFTNADNDGISVDGNITDADHEEGITVDGQLTMKLTETLPYDTGLHWC